ncbi:hypothetical protein [Streptomyces sp. NBC_01618]|uniref:hypothetical protein n=1 Tax=Streptomyces sp. NBC_01618 TaxID=2975900 RepID=UPI00386BA06E|nr:hypothetical protein OH735_08660 [Streptomyces sp. NBC_01618]
MTGENPKGGKSAEGLDPARRAALTQDLLRALAAHQDDTAARGDEWSRPASALANAVAATKAVLRGQPQTARGLLERGFRRIDAPDRGTGQWFADIRRLAEAAADREPGLRPLADRVVRLARSRLAGSGEEAPRRRDAR